MKQQDLTFISQFFALTVINASNTQEIRIKIDFSSIDQT